MVRYECGCIGLHSFTERSPRKGDESIPHDFIVYFCDESDTSNIPGWRAMKDKEFVEVKNSERIRILEELSQLAADGSKFRELKSLLK